MATLSGVCVCACVCGSVCGQTGEPRGHAAQTESLFSDTDDSVALPGTANVHMRVHACKHTLSLLYKCYM